MLNSKQILFFSVQFSLSDSTYAEHGVREHTSQSRFYASLNLYISCPRMQPYTFCRYQYTEESVWFSRMLHFVVFLSDQRFATRYGGQVGWVLWKKFPFKRISIYFITNWLIENGYLLLEMNVHNYTGIHVNIHRVPKKHLRSYILLTF